MEFITEHKPTVDIFVLSDSAGETVVKLAHAAIAQFPTINFHLYRRSFIKDETLLLQALNEAKEHQAIILHTLVNKKLSKISHDYCKLYALKAYDMLNPILNEIEEQTEVLSIEEPGALHHLNESYFKRIKAMEFAVKYDDGKDPRGFLKADIVLLGVSRTSKTPLSIFLANKTLNVANLPLIPSSTLPKEIFKVNPKKIVGLTNDPTILNHIRKERMRSYGLTSDTAYSNINKIKEELAFADQLYKKLGCLVINVAHLSIEETASLILEKLELEDKTYQID